MACWDGVGIVIGRWCFLMMNDDVEEELCLLGGRK